MRIRLGLASLLLLGACGGGSDFVDGGSDMPSVLSASPEFGPLGGGSTVLVTGNGFLNAGAAPNHVLVGGHEAAAAGIIDDNTIEVVIPEGDSPGDAEIVVYNSNGYASATGIFHYSTLPEITAMSPDSVRYDVGGTITLTGSGFEDEDAGVSTVLIDGLPAIDVDVASDTSMTFTALPGIVFDQPVITVINRRGEGSNTGYKYGPGPAGGLIAFLRTNGTAAPTRFGMFFDPLTLALQPIPVKAMFGGGGSGLPYFRTVFQNSTGQYIGIDHVSNQLQLLDLDAQTTTSQISLAYRVSEASHVGATTYMINRDTNRFGSVDLTTGVFTPIGAAVIGTCCNGSGLAADTGGTMYIAFGNNLYTISRTTGTLGAAVPLTGLNGRLMGMRFLGSALYGITNSNAIVTINTTTGVCDIVASYNDGVSSFRSLETVQ